MMTEAQHRIWDRVVPEPNSGCWLWNLTINRGGYGQMKHRGITMRAHRASFEAFHWPIPEGLEIDHLCRVRCCVNPAHLEPVTRKVNVLRGKSPSAKHARKTHCSRGHSLTGNNLHINPNGARSCRACTRINTAAYKKRKQEQQQ